MLSICHLSIIPVRKEASDKSEQVTQLLFGELAEVLETNGNWATIKTWEEGYPGFVDPRQLTLLSDEESLLVQTTWNRVVSSPTAELTLSNCTFSKRIVAGSRLPAKDAPEIKPFGKLEVSGDTLVPARPSAGDLHRHALQYLGAPYLWGGRSPFGIDCSGFTQLVFRLNGITLPRDAWQQAATGMPLSEDEETRTGDLAFFKNPEGRVVHVGMILEPGRIIHASGEVRIDTLDKEGILNNSTGNYSHRFDSLRRYF